MYHKDKKKKQLGMNPSTASNRLKKSILFSFAKKLGLNWCYQCGAEITNIDKWGLPSQVIWNCDDFWSIDFFNSTANIPIINGTSFADPLLDSVYCIMAPVGSMVGDTIEIKGTAYFEEGDISLQDSFHIIFE